MKIPEYWILFRDSNHLQELEITIPENDDLSELGVEMEFFNDSDIISERDDLYPGIAVAKDGFVPVGGCMIGSGDPYFINTNDGEGGPLYRILHEMIAVEDDDSSSYEPSDAVEKVLDDYRNLLLYIDNKG